MKTKTINIYTFDELKKDVQEKVIEDFRDGEEYLFLREDLRWRLKDLLLENEIKGDEDIYYSLNYSQGDGVMFFGHFEWRGYTVTIQHTGRYYHENSKITYIENEDGEDAEEELYKEFDVIYVNICRELKRYGYDLMETATSDENITEMIRVNDYYFTEEGELTKE
jgi:hypothetical protein